MHTKKFIVFLLALFCFAAFATCATAQGKFIPAFSSWKYLDTGADLSAQSWKALAFDDSAWFSGGAPLGYADAWIVTTVSFGPNSAGKYVTTYFRRSIVVTNTATVTALNLRVQRDDGIIVYLNGTEVLRDNMPGGAVTSSTLASAAAGDDGAAFLAFTNIGTGALVLGTNLVAVEVHQSAIDSSDQTMDLELTRGANLPPAVALTEPTNGASFSAGQHVTLSATANDFEGVARVEFFAGGQSLGVDTTAPYSLVWSNVLDGVYNLTAVVTDTDGVTATNGPITISVTDPAPPRLVGASATTNQVTVVFSKRVLPPTATALSSYGINNGVTISAAAFSGGSLSNTIVLNTSLLQAGTTYTLTVNNVQDVLGQSVAANSQTNFSVSSFTAASIGSPTPASTVTSAAGGFNITAGGNDIGGSSDQFAFNYQMIAGDFDVKVRVASLSLVDTWTKAGLMARDSLNVGATFAGGFTTPGAAGSFFSSRATANTAATTAGFFPANYPNTWLRLQRTNNLFTGLASFDGENWLSLGSATIGMAPNILVGMAVSSRTNGVAATAQFRDFQTVIGGTVGTVILPREPAGPSSRRTPFVITEIMYNPLPRPDSNSIEFIELYNSNPFPEEISNYRLSGDIDYTFPSNTFIPASTYVVIARNPALVQSVYTLSNVMGPYTNALKGSGTIRLRNNSDGIILEIPYDSQPPWPTAADGAGHSLVLARPSYGEANPQAWDASDVVGGSPGGPDGLTVTPQRNVLINEFLAASETPFEDYIELYNHGNQPVSLAGCTLSDDPHTNKFTFAMNATIAARGFLTVYQSQFNFGLSSGGETIYFRAADGLRMLDCVRFEAQATNVSAGRFPDGAADFYPMASRTPDAANSAPLVHDVVINEIMYKSISGSKDDEYVELYNKGATTVSLAGWRFTAGIDFKFPTNAALAPDSYLVVARDLGRMLTNYPNLNSNNTYGNFKGSLPNRGGRLALAVPSISITTNGLGQAQTNTVHVVMDEVTYGTGGNWGSWANEGGSSLELIDARANHRLAHSWADSDETAKAPWTSIDATNNIDLGGETPNALEAYLMNEGECLIDNLEMLPVGGVNVVPNGTFASGQGTWVFRGSHIRTSIDSTSGFGGGNGLRVRASSRGDSIINRLYVPLTSALSTSGTGVIRAKVRWQRGWPEMIIRTHGNWLETVVKMTVPKNLGTPGARNSRAVTNAPPAIYQVRHDPVVPDANQSVVVSARRFDPDGTASMTLRYRTDSAGNYNYSSVAMQDNGTAGDLIAGDGIYSATLPGQSAGVLVAFQVLAVDSLGATNLFPQQIPSYPRPFECLVRFGDPVPSSGFGTYRQWLTADNVSDWQNRPALSNERIFGSFVYGNYRAIYNMSTKWSASPYHQFGGSPVTTDAHYSIELPLDDQALGTENFNKLHLPGNGAGDDTTLQREQIGYWTARQLKLPWGYRRYVAMYVNGTRRGGPTRLMEDSQTPGSDMLDEFFPNDTDGNLFKLQPWFETDDGTGQSIGFRNISWCTQLKFTTTSNGVPVHKAARYRNNYLVRAAGGTANDYQSVFDLVDAGNSALPNNNLLTQNFSAVADWDQWFRIFACEHATGNWDSVGARNEQNMYGYKPRDKKWTLMIWDWNILLGNSGSWGAGTELFTVTSGQAGPLDNTMQGFYSHPPFRRSYLRSLKEIVTGPWLAANVEPVLDAKYRAMVTGGVTPVDPTAIKTYISTARSSILTTVTGEEAAAFKISTTNVITTSNNLVTLTGEAPISVQAIIINGIAYTPVWTSVKAWTIQLPVALATNALALAGYDRFGQPITGFATNLTVIYSGALVRPEDALVINEIMYHPTVPQASFLEIYNNSNVSFDLSRWHVNGVDYTFPDGSVISNRQYLILVENRSAALGAYGSNLVVFGEFEGSLDNGGETVTLERPVSLALTNTSFLSVSKVRYDHEAPWPTAADGGGFSLQLTDPSADNSRVSNWSAQGGWVRATYTGTIQSNGTSFLLFLNSAGDIYVDDLVLVTNNVADVGPNLLQNAGFETPFGAEWTTSGNHVTSARSTQFAHSGTASLHLIATGAGGPSAAVRQILAALPATMPCTLSFWYLPSTNGTQLTMRTTPGALFIANTLFAPKRSTPGALNSSVGTLPAYDPLWINEVQPNNLTGLADNFGERDPWIEIHNRGTNTLDLGGYYLADNFTNLLLWQFPGGTTIAPGGFQLVWADAQPLQTSGTNLHASFRLASAAGQVALSRLTNGTQLTDYLKYGGIGPDLSYGDFPDGQPFSRQTFFTVTPNATNSAKDVNLFINEWMASNLGTLADPADNDFEDWFELYNPGETPVDLEDYYLTDNLGNRTQYRIPAGYVIPAHGFLLVWADSETGQNSTNRPDLHVNFQLAKGGEAIGLYAPNGTTPIDTISFTNQLNDVSEGRYADGAAPRYFMSTPTPRGPNTIGLANTAPAVNPIANLTIRLGQTASTTVTGTDPDFPVQTLTFSLDPGYPLGANILSGGQFTWTPTAGQAPSTNTITVRAMDNGSPQLSGTRSFTIIVRLPPVASISNDGSGHVVLGFDTIAGRTYRIEWKDNLDDAAWTQLGSNVTAASETLTVQDNLGANPHRFYQIIQTD